MKEKDNLDDSMSNNLIVVSIVLLLTALSCTTLDSQSVEDASEFKMPFLVNKFDFDLTLEVKKEFGTARYVPHYFGPIKDTIDVGYILCPQQNPSRDYLENQGEDSVEDSKSAYNEADRMLKRYYKMRYGRLENIPHWDSMDIEIHVDTTQITFNMDGGEIEAHPVIIINKTEFDLLVGRGSYLHLIMEAKNRHGEWRPIERRHGYIYCSTGVPDIILPAKECVITSAKKYQGDFVTDFRLRIGNHFSETYKGTMDERQFGGIDKTLIH